MITWRLTRCNPWETLFGIALWCRLRCISAVRLHRILKSWYRLRGLSRRRRPPPPVFVSWCQSTLVAIASLYSRHLMPIVGHHGFYFFFSLFSPAASLCPPAGLRLPRRAASFARHWLILLRSADFDAAPPLRLRVNEANARERLPLSAFVLALVCARPPDVWRLPYWFVYCVR